MTEPAICGITRATTWSPNRLWMMVETTKSVNRKNFGRRLSLAGLIS